MLDGRDGGPARYLVSISTAGATLSERTTDGGADAELEGTTAEWVHALGPLGDRDELRSSGPPALTGLVLDLLSLGRGREELAPAETAS